jgi:hypothetical protein
MNQQHAHTTLMHTFDPVRFEAFASLLDRPDPTGLPRRAHVLRLEGDPDRRVTRFPAIMMGWLQRRHLEVDLDEPVIAAIRAPACRMRGPNPGLRLLRPTGTG